MATASINLVRPEPPLSWKEARYRLRDLLESHLSSPPYLEKKREQKLEERKNWLKLDLDFYFGAFGASLALLIIASVGSSEQDTDINVRRSQLVAAIFMFTGCIFNLWVVRRRRFSTSKGSDSLRRWEISNFLKALEKQEEEFERISSYEDIDESMDSGLNLSGNSLNDIYPVYRLFHKPNKPSSNGSWSRIPSLLLVKGDYIALQVGDTVPADCRLVDSSAKIIRAGERITLETFGEKPHKVLNNLPRGRTTMKNKSEDLLTLCNQLRIFVLLESPLETFLHQRRGMSFFEMVYSKICLTFYHVAFS